MSLDHVPGLIDRDVRTAEATGSLDLKGQAMEQLAFAGRFRLMSDLTIARCIDVMNGVKFFEAASKPDVLPFSRISSIPHPPLAPQRAAS